MYRYNPIVPVGVSPVTWKNCGVPSHVISCVPIALPVVLPSLVGYNPTCITFTAAPSTHLFELYVVLGSASTMAVRNPSKLTYPNVTHLADIIQFTGHPDAGVSVTYVNVDVDTLLPPCIQVISPSVLVSCISSQYRLYPPVASP